MYIVVHVVRRREKARDKHEHEKEIKSKEQETRTGEERSSPSKFFHTLMFIYFSTKAITANNKRCLISTRFRK